ncbi:hypothetical protein [Arachidicoccus soli]|uniref:Uncharacterized protein n=2 Tax=Arachidicoccus TaxID=1769012 RepID=A0A386HST9_9BACT|nr:hypothetical protein [Arachidicoccus soli]AYD49048.1 hypothetical protein D6B99_16355 [Arachidicoccus soli]
MKIEKVFLFLFFLGIFPKLFGQLNSDGFVKRGDTIFLGTSSIPLSQKNKQLSPKEDVYKTLVNICHIDVGFDEGQHFRIVDSIYGFYSPTPLEEAFHGFQIVRTFAEKSNSNYLIGIFLFSMSPHEGTFPLKESITKQARILMNGNDRFYEPNSCTYLTSIQLKKINAKDSFGIVYNIKVTKPFKGKYYKCKALAFENEKGNFITLYYFYNEKDEKQIMHKIFDQLGMVKFKT